jgi:hypothetical protein
VSTALVPVAPSEDRSLPDGGGRPRADFLAQLIATVAQAPQTRARRRAEPNDAIAAYDAGGRSPVPAGRTLARSL